MVELGHFITDLSNNANTADTYCSRTGATSSRYIDVSSPAVTRLYTTCRYATLDRNGITVFVVVNVYYSAGQLHSAVRLGSPSV